MIDYSVSLFLLLCHSPSTARNDRSFNMNLMKLPKKTQSDWTETLTYDMLCLIWAGMSSCELCWFLLQLVHLLDSCKFKIDWSHRYRLSPFNDFTFFLSLNLESRKHLIILKNVAICYYLTNVHPCAETCCPLPNHSRHSRLHAPKLTMSSHSTSNRRTARNAALVHIRYQCPSNIKTCPGRALSNTSFDCKMSRPRHSLKFGQILMSVRFIAPAALWHLERFAGLSGV